MKAQTIVKLTTFILLLLLLLTSVSLPVSAEPPTPLAVKIPLGQLTDSQPLRLTGLTNSLEVDLPTSPFWRLAGDATLLVKASYADALDARKSELVFSVNDTPVASLPLADLHAAGTSAILPAVRFGQSDNRLTILAHLYLKTDPAQAGCRDLADPARWLEISPDSSLTFSLNRQVMAFTLRDFPNPFQGIDFYPAGFSQIPTVFVLPDQSSASDLRSLAAAAFAFGRAMPDNNAWPLEVLSRSQLLEKIPAETNLVFLSGSQQGLVNLDRSGQEALLLAPSPFNPQRAALVIADANPEDGSRPELALIVASQRFALSGSFAALAPAAPPAPGDHVLPEMLSFEELGYHSRTVGGAGEHSLIYRVYLPYDLQLTSASLDLILYHSQNLQGRSIANIYVNGVNLAGILLNDRDQNGEMTEINLPAKHFRPGINYLRITFDLKIPVGSCAADDTSTWATVADTSLLEIESTRSAHQPTLGDFPQPFNGEAGAVLVLPEHPDAETLNRVARLAILIGQSAQPDSLPPTVVTAATFDRDVDGNQHLVLIGTPQQNPMVSQINAALPQPFKASGLGLAVGYGITNSAENQPTGLVEVSRSPWNGNRRILVITGVDEQSFLNAFDRMLAPEPQTPGLTGNVLAVRSSQSGQLEAQNLLIQDPGNLPLAGRGFQAIDQLGIDLSLVAIALGLAFLFLIILGIRWIERQQEITQKVERHEPISIDEV